LSSGFYSELLGNNSSISGKKSQMSFNFSQSISSVSEVKEEDSLREEQKLHNLMDEKENLV